MGFEGTVRRHYEKLKIAEHLKPAADTCPVCDSPTERGAAISEAIRHSMAVIRSESVAVENVRPRLIEHQDSLGMEIDRLNRQLSEVDERIKTWIRQSEEVKHLNTLAEYHANLQGKVSQFLEMNPTTPQPGSDLGVLRDEIQSLEGQIDTEAKKTAAVCRAQSVRIPVGVVRPVAYGGSLYRGRPSVFLQTTRCSDHRARLQGCFAAA